MTEAAPADALHRVIAAIRPPNSKLKEQSRMFHLALSEVRQFHRIEGQSPLHLGPFPSQWMHRPVQFRDNNVTSVRIHVCGYIALSLSLSLARGWQHRPRNPDVPG